MSELKNISGNQIDFRARLLITACSTALLTALCANLPAAAADADRPMVWLELGGEFAQLQNGQEPYLPPFTLVTPRLSFIVQSPADTEKAMPVSWDGNAKISFQPVESDWIFSAAIQYGRNTRNKTSSQRTTHHSSSQYFLRYEAYQNISAKNTSSHMVVDFAAGKDMGLGVLGGGGDSIVRFGLRYAQFDSRSKSGIQYQPTNNDKNFHIFYGAFDAARKFIGLGPSLSWDASAGLIGEPATGGITLDWGLNGAVLFGRQRTNAHHQTTNLAVTYPYLGIGFVKQPLYQHSGAPPRSKQVVVPNIGGFAGVSWRYPDAKISVGYRADFFFGAMDGGIDTAHRENVGFYGPFASVSIGVGG
jgi:iron complex outermembrane receptor protein